jgi:hypothetical protein
MPMLGWRLSARQIGAAIVGCFAGLAIMVVAACNAPTPENRLPVSMSVVVDGNISTVFALLRDAPPPRQFGAIGSEDLAPEVTVATGHELNRRLLWDLNLDGTATVRVSATLTPVNAKQTRVEVQTGFPESRLTQAAALSPGDLAIVAAAANAAFVQHAVAIAEQREPEPFYSDFERTIERLSFNDVPYENKNRVAFRERIRKTYDAVTKPTAERLAARLGPQWYLAGVEPAEPSEPREPGGGDYDATDTGPPPTARMRDSAAPTASAAPAVNVER